MEGKAEGATESENQGPAPTQAPLLRIEAAPQFFNARTFPPNSPERPLSKPTRRRGRITRIAPGPDVGSGTAYRRHIPLTMHVRVNASDGTPLSALLDTGASLSVIDRNLLQTLGGSIQGKPLPVHGLGSTRSLGWTTIVFFVDAREAGGGSVLMECALDFHVLEAFALGICLGQDFISTHAVEISSRQGRAALNCENKRLTFPVHDHLPSPYGKEAELCVSSDCVIPARSHAWVRVDCASLAPSLDYTVYPRLSTNVTETVRLAGPIALLNARTSHILLTNVGTEDAVLQRRTPVADAQIAHLGDTVVRTASTFSPMEVAPPARVHATAAEPAVAEESSVDLTPPSLHDLPDPADPPDDIQLHETTTVDGVFKVGTDSSGQAHPEVVDLLRRHKEAFALDGRPGRVVGNEMKIDLFDDSAVHPEAPRRASPEKRALMDKAIDQLLSWDVIEPSDSRVSFPVLMVRQGEKWRMCIDYRQLNQHTVPDAYPLPTTDAVFSALSGKKVFSSLDALRGYHQMGIREQDRWKTAFACPRGLFQYKTVPFGLRNAPAAFQRLMDSLLGSLRWTSAVVYIDDVVLATTTYAAHLDALDTPLTRAEKIGLRFSPSKCTFAVSSLILLGRKVSAAGVAVWRDRARVVLDLQRPRTLRALYHALGLFGYYRMFIPNFATIATPLTQLTQGWRYEKVGDRCRLVDAEGRPASADNVLIPWAGEQDSAFQALKTAIANPPVLAHPDPERPYILHVDASTQGFGAVLHQVFEMRAGERVVPEDVMASIMTVQSSLIPPLASVDRWRTWLERDRYFGPVLRSVETGGADAEDWMLEGDRLVRRSDGACALPEAALPEMLRWAHEANGHFGFSKTHLLLRRDFWRPGLSVAVRAWVRHCTVCAQTKNARRSGELRIDNDASLPFEAIALDLLLGFPRSASGNDAVVVISDIFSRMVILEPCKSTISAEGIASVISNRVLRMGWRPRRLIPDSEARLTGEVMTTLAASLKATVTPSLPHHHQANPAERCVQTVRHVLQALSTVTRAHWDRRAVPAAELAMNSTPSVTTGFRPFDLVFVSHPDVLHALFDAEDHAGVSTFSERLAAAEERLADARAAIEQSLRTQKRRYDASRQPLPKLVEGSRVYVRLDDRPMPGMRTDKLASRKDGPFTVAEVLSPHRVRLELPAGMGINDEFDVSQLDVLPSSPDPFAAHRVNAAEDRAEVDAEEPELEDGAAEGGELVQRQPSRRARRPPVALRDFATDAALATLSPEMFDACRGPYRRARRMIVNGEEIALVERPIAYLSRGTTPSERRLVAAELELVGLAWAFGRWLHLLEGAEVTVVTDHAPLGPMLTSSSGAKYGPVISRCRALMMPHLAHLRFVYRPGASHTNADALSRLVTRPETADVLEGGDVMDEPHEHEDPAHPQPVACEHTA